MKPHFVHLVSGWSSKAASPRVCYSNCNLWIHDSLWSGLSDSDVGAVGAPGYHILGIPHTHGISSH